MNTSEFTIPEVKKISGKWYVEYYFLVPPEFAHLHNRPRKRFKVYEEINSQQPGKQDAYASLLRDAVELALRTGYNPFEVAVARKQELEFRKQQKEIIDSGKPILVLLKAYLVAKEKEGCRSMGSFKTTINHFTKWLASKGWTDRGVKLFTEDDIIDFLETCRETEGWGSTTWNSNRGYVYSWFSWFVIQKILPHNIVTKRVPIAKKSSVTRNEDYQGRVRELVNLELAKDPVLRRLCRGVYYTCARSYKEFCFIKIWHVDRHGKLIKVPDGKTGYRHIPLCEEMEDMLFNEMKIDRYPHEYYIFGPGAEPSEKYADKNHFSNRYKKLKDKLNLGTEYSIYGWKHTRVCDLLASGKFTHEEVMELTGHTDTGSFDKYKRGLGRRITNKLKGKTISFD